MRLSLLTPAGLTRTRSSSVRWSRKPYNCAANTPPGALAWFACSSVGAIPSNNSLRSARCSVGSSVPDWHLRPAVVGRVPHPSGRSSHTKSGKWMLRIKSLYAMVRRSVGSGSWMNAAAQSLRLQFSPLAYWNTVAVGRVQDVLRRAFRRWGRPGCFRVDNGTPWGSIGDLPTDLALWLLGLDIAITFNAPRRPQENGVVERSQGTGKRWAEPGACATVKELQRRLQEMDVIQREEYPSLKGRSRLQVYPGLKHSGRAYSRSWERKHWRLDLVLEHLAGYAVPRKVDKSGTVSVYNRNHYVGKFHTGKTVYVTLDPLSREWIFQDDHGNQLRAQPAEQICRQRIETLTVTSRR